MAVHRPGSVILIVVTFISLLAAIAVTYLEYVIQFRELAPDFYKFPENISYEILEISPSPWTYQIMIPVFFYQFLWLSYSLSLLCRKSNDWQGYLYYRPGFMPAGLFVFFILNMGLNIAWTFVWDREILIAASVVKFGVAITVNICLAISYWALHKKGTALFRLGHTREIVLVRVLVHNGLSMYSAWITIESLLNLGILLQNQVGLDQKDASTIVLGILGFFIIVYFIVDIFITDKWSRYTFTTYIVLIIAIAGILDNLWVPGNRNSIISAMLIGLSGFAFLLKIGITATRCRTEPEPILRDATN